MVIRNYKKTIKQLANKHKLTSLLVNQIKYGRRLSIKDFQQTNQIKKQYNKLRFPDSSGAKIAVILHLYYIEPWPLISEKLKNLQEHSFDLYVTLPNAHSSYVKEIKSSFSMAHVFEVPNRGRDVLPFMEVASKLLAYNYEYILKLHSKKSPHRTDGSDWFKDMLSKLLPEAVTIRKKLFTTLKKKNTGLVGPAGQYTSLKVNFEANGRHMTNIMDRMYSDTMSYNILQKQRSDYGFFAGTMFWARMDAIEPILNSDFYVSDFEPEEGQIDATYAHAMERLFCIIPEIQHKLIYELDLYSVTQIPYKTDNIPDWSDVYIGPKK